MFGVGIFELLIIFIVILLVFGPEKLPTVARTMAKYVGDFRRVSDELKRTVMNATEDVRDPIKFLNKPDGKPQGDDGRFARGTDSIPETVKGEATKSKDNVKGGEGNG